MPTPLELGGGKAVLRFPEYSAAELRARVARACQLARTFEHDEPAPDLRAWTKTLEAQADALNSSSKNDEVVR